MLKTFSGRNASQDPEELGGFIDFLRGSGVRRYLEIGARHGDTFHEVMISLPPGSTGVAVDLPGGLWGTSKSRRSLERAVADLVSHGYKASALFGDSKAEATRRLVIGRGPYDAALIDGDHSLAGVMADWANFGTVAPLIAFHDIVGTGCAEKVNGTPVEVPILWAELRAQHRVVEFVAPGSRMGIGVVCAST